MEETPEEGKKKRKGRPMGQRYEHTWSIRLSGKQVEWLRRLAERDDCDQVDVVRRAINELARREGLDKRGG